MFERAEGVIEANPPIMAEQVSTSNAFNRALNSASISASNSASECDCPADNQSQLQASTSQPISKPMSQFMSPGEPNPLHSWSQAGADSKASISTALSSGIQPSPLDNHVFNIPRGYRWQLLSAQWLRDFTPEYVLALELPQPEVPALLPRTDIDFPPQLDWPLTYQRGASLRPGGWKESNLRFRFLQSRDLSFPVMA
ncbi:hypothetical protein [Shewanella zhangzhouensis]|uniref:hypothetical protein n=1 Tax=Shewanella zhangzhouensis TaxID=2864213 RepID=UPI001C6612C8|nr:hypothetical protein [Shewanella zhangzhouensis]QYK04165.1 hypothetical protein K0H63_13885 [Shewanella zhangzhouensis]